jgi:serine/threonine protein kinase
MNWKIADFGISKLRNNPVTGFTFQGAHTKPWAPPEQVAGATAHPSADIYALGRVLTFLLTGSQDRSSVQQAPQHWAEILVACVDFSPEKRPDVNFVRSRIEQLLL